MNTKLNREHVGYALKIAVPAMVESFFTAFAGLVDSYMVSGISSDAVAAVGLTTQPKFLGLSVFIAISISLSALVARRLGQGDKKSANGILITGLTLILALSAVISTLLVVFASPVIRWCGSTSETHDMAVSYFSIIMSGSVFTCIQMGINSAQRGAGNTKITMITNITSNTVNVILNYILINGHLGFPKMGIQGAALATVLGTVVAAIMSIRSILPESCFVSITYIIKHKIKPALCYLKNIISVAYSVFFEQILMRIGFMATAIMAAHQGNAAMAAHQVGMNIMGLTFSFGDGLQSAAVALIGRSLGEKNIEKAKSYSLSCLFIGAVIAVALSFVYLVGAEPLMKLFFKEKEIVSYGVTIMHIIIFVVIFQIIQIIFTGSLRGAGDTKYTAITAAVSVTVIRTLVSYVGANVLSLGIAGVWLGILGDQVSRFVMSGIRFKQGKWVNIKI